MSLNSIVVLNSFLQCLKNVCRKTKKSTWTGKLKQIFLIVIVAIFFSFIFVCLFLFLYCVKRVFLFQLLCLSLVDLNAVFDHWVVWWMPFRIKNLYEQANIKYTTWWAIKFLLSYCLVLGEIKIFLNRIIKVSQCD